MHMKPEETQNTPSNPEQKEQSGGYYNPRFQVMLQTTVIKTLWYSHKNRHVF